MGYMNNAQIEISNWLNSERTYEDGVILYEKYGKNQTLKRLFPRREIVYAQKLAYELGKLIGIGFVEFNSGEVVVSDSESAPVIPDPKRGIFYPPVIDRIKAEMSTLYNERSLLKTQQNNIPDENIAENVAKRKELIQLIAAISGRLDILFQAKKSFLEADILPDEKELFAPLEGNDIPSSTPEELEKRRKNLRSYLSKARNFLDFQSEKKPKDGKLNPLPDCPKREQLGKQIAAWENEIAEIEKKEKDVDQLRSDPGTGQDEL
ncbi:MAG: hypothetical protein RRY39_06710 [Odoribacter sp.]